MTTDRVRDDKATISAELEERAIARATITYGEAAALVGRTARGLGKILAAIKADEAKHRRPDLGCLVVTVRTGLPSYVGLGQDARDKAIADQEAVFNAWSTRG